MVNFLEKTLIKIRAKSDLIKENKEKIDNLYLEKNELINETEEEVYKIFNPRYISSLIIENNMIKIINRNGSIDVFKTFQLKDIIKSIFPDYNHSFVGNSKWQMTLNLNVSKENMFIINETDYISYSQINNILYFNFNLNENIKFETIRSVIHLLKNEISLFSNEKDFYFEVENKFNIIKENIPSNIELFFDFKESINFEDFDYMEKEFTIRFDFFNDTFEEKYTISKLFLNYKNIIESINQKYNDFNKKIIKENEDKLKIENLYKNICSEFSSFTVLKNDHLFIIKKDLFSFELDFKEFIIRDKGNDFYIKEIKKSLVSYFKNSFSLYKFQINFSKDNIFKKSSNSISIDINNENSYLYLSKINNSLLSENKVDNFILNDFHINNNNELFIMDKKVSGFDHSFDFDNFLTNIRNSIFVPNF